jgi:molybdenum cofactor synthesis domain-containing protein
MGRPVKPAKATQHRDPEEEVPLVAIEDHLTRILADIDELPPRALATADAWGCVLAADVRSTFDMPPFASSAMDGYAVRADDIAQASERSPVELRVTGEVRMGRPGLHTVGPGEAVAVPTGGIVPLGADAVVPVELCVLRDGTIEVLRALPAAKHVRPAGEDVRRGDVLVARGRCLRAADVGALAAAGFGTASVIPPARVGIISTGDELVAPGEELADGKIYDSNAVMLAALVSEAGAHPVPGGTVRDAPDELRAALDELAPHVDAFVCSGGVSMGERDPVKALLRDDVRDAAVSFTNVAMQPGRPQAFGRWNGKPFFGLPGNPVSVFVSFEVFVRPALMKLMGRTDERPTVEAVLEGELRAPNTRDRYARVRLTRDAGAYIARPEGGHQSNLLVSFARADGLVRVPAGTGMGNGERCRVILWRAPS